MNSILYFDPARDRWDTRRPDSLRNRVDPPSSISILTVTWTAPPTGGSGSGSTTAESESQAVRVDRLIREHNTPTIIALAGVPRAFVQQLLAQQSVRQGYAFSQLEGDSSSCALLWKISFAVFFVEPKVKGFPCILAHSRELFGAPAVISTAAFPASAAAGNNQVSGGSADQLRELWEGYLGSVGSDTTTIAVCFVGSSGASNVGGLRASLRPSPVDAVSDGPHAIWFRAADGRQISAQAGVPPLQNLSDRITQVTLATLAGGQSPAPSNSQTPVPAALSSGAIGNQQQQQQAMMMNNNNNRNTNAVSGGTSPQQQNSQQQQPGRSWILKNNCNIKVRENTVEILYDLSPCFARSEDCIRTLNNTEQFRWNSDFAICHGRLFACSGARADLGSFQRWMKEHDPPITHPQRTELIANKAKLMNLGNGGASAILNGTSGVVTPSGLNNNNNTTGMFPSTSGGQTQSGMMMNNNNNNGMSPQQQNPMQQQQQHQTAAQHLFGNNNNNNNMQQQQSNNNNMMNPATSSNQYHQQQLGSNASSITNTSSSIAANNNAATTSGLAASAAASGPTGTRFYRRGWTVGRAVLLHQVGPVELQAFDVTAELGVIPRPLPALVDRLNGLASAASQHQYPQVHMDPLASYSKDYALCYCAERRGYWLVAAPNVPCDPVIARAVALQLKKQRAAAAAAAAGGSSSGGQQIAA